MSIDAAMIVLEAETTFLLGKGEATLMMSFELVDLDLEVIATGSRLDRRDLVVKRT